MTVALVLTKTRMMITENSLKMLYYNTHTVLEQRTFTLQKCSVRSETNCKNQIVFKNLRIHAHLLHLSESHLLRLYFGVFQPSVFCVFPVRRNKLSIRLNPKLEENLKKHRIGSRPRYHSVRRSDSIKDGQA